MFNEKAAVVLRKTTTALTRMTGQRVSNTSN
jgi:hypothetical protein